MIKALRTTAGAWLAFIAVLLLLSGSAAQATQPQDDIPFQTVEKYLFSGHTQAKNYIITNDEDWKNLWDTVHHANAPPLPEIDFARQMIIAVFQGEKPSGGYGIVITELIKAGKRLRVKVTELMPDPGCINFPAVEDPGHIIITERLSKKVLRHVSFEVEQQVQSCK